MARIGYARGSTIDQDLDAQLGRLEAEGCGVIGSEKVSGGSREGRAELATVIEFLRSCDELAVTRLDRPGRDNRNVTNLIHEAEQRGAFVTVLVNSSLTGPEAIQQGTKGATKLPDVQRFVKGSPQSVTLTNLMAGPARSDAGGYRAGPRCCRTAKLPPFCRMGHRHRTDTGVDVLLCHAPLLVDSSLR